jgi:hypothetical protein
MTNEREYIQEINAFIQSRNSSDPTYCQKLQHSEQVSMLDYWEGAHVDL